MGETVSDKIMLVEPGDEFRVCQDCGYGRCFHTSFLRDGEEQRIVLICPNCGARYDAGWRAML